MDFIGLGIFAGLIVLFGWLALRAWRAKNAVVKWVGVVLAGLLTLVCTLVLVLSLVGYYNLYSPRSNPVANVKVAGTAEQAKRGEKLAQLCASCHGEQMFKQPLSGRDLFLPGPGGEAPPPIGAVWSANLTPAGDLKNWSDGEVIRAIREGVHKSGRSLAFMPFSAYRSMSDEDVQSLVAYLRTVPPAGNPHPEPRFTVLGAIMLATLFGEFMAQPPIGGPVKALPGGVSPERGEYTVNIASCRDCHGKQLEGSPGSDANSGTPNLTQSVPKWSEADFVRFFRTGVRPDGRPVDENRMPWRALGDFAGDDELKSMFAYLKTLQPITR